MVLEFYELEYHGKLDFAKLEYPKSGSSLHISETVVDCNIVCKKVLFGYFCPKICPIYWFDPGHNSLPQGENKYSHMTIIVY